MSNRINPYRHNVYRPQSASQPNRAEAAQKAEAPAEAQRSSEAPEPEAMKDLSRPEQKMIQRYFPDNPDLSMRLYGADRNEQQVNPEALGSHIDLRG